MKALIVSDGELYCDITEKLRSTVLDYLEEHHFDCEEARVGRGEINFCMGCFGCWVKKPGECVIDDRISSINRSSMTSDAVFYLSPIVFGQFSANIKNVIDRWLPNMLPFFETRPDGSTMHPPRYKDYPQQVMIGFSDSLTDEDAQLFKDIVNKHRKGIEVLLYDGDQAKLRRLLGRLDLTRKGGQL